MRASSLAASSCSTLALNGIPNNGWPVGMAVKKSNRELGQAIEDALKSLRDSRRIAEDLPAAGHDTHRALSAPLQPDRKAGQATGFLVCRRR